MEVPLEAVEPKTKQRIACRGIELPEQSLGRSCWKRTGLMLLSDSYKGAWHSEKLFWVILACSLAGRVQLLSRRLAKP